MYGLRALLLLVALTAAACGDAPSGRPLRLVTTTSTHDSGLLSYLLAPWKEETGIDVDVISVGTGQALAHGRRGDADLVLVHAREQEDRFVAEGHGVDRRDVMWNDFVILGPTDDPVGVRGTEDPVQALRKIAAAGATFVSRGDGSGTHIREQALWERAGVVPRGEAYWKAGDGMGACLVIADQKRAYLLADRGTYIAFGRRVDLAVLVEGHPSLRNPYGAMLVNPQRHPHVEHEKARSLLDYLTSEAGQRRIADFRVEGQVLFHPARSE